MLCIQVLLDAGCNFKHKDQYKLTAADHATRNGIDFFHKILKRKIAEQRRRVPGSDEDENQNAKKHLSRKNRSQKE